MSVFLFLKAYRKKLGQSFSHENNILGVIINFRRLRWHQGLFKGGGALFRVWPPPIGVYFVSNVVGAT